MTLREVMAAFTKLCPEGFAKLIITHVAQAIQRMRSVGVVHSHITQDVIGLVKSKSAPGGFKFSKLGGFEFAFKLKEPKPIPRKVL